MRPTHGQRRVPLSTRRGRPAFLGATPGSRRDSDPNGLSAGDGRGDDSFRCSGLTTIGRTCAVVGAPSSPGGGLDFDAR
jgi:hypothetical protein